MQTTKEQMSEYLSKAQTLQRMAMGIADVSISTSLVCGGETSLTVYVFPLDEKNNFIPDVKVNGNYLYHRYYFAEWEYAETNEKALKDMLVYQRELLDL
jgi:hypothetical protein